MEDYGGQQRLIAPETSLERTVRTGSIDFLGMALTESMEEMAALLDDVVERPDHYYDRAKNLMPVASSIGELMARKTLRVLSAGTDSDVNETRQALRPNVLKHTKYTPGDSESVVPTSHAFDILKGLEQERTAYRILMDTPTMSESGYEFNILRSSNGLPAKLLCTLVDSLGASGKKVLMFSELCATFPDAETVAFYLRRFVDLRVIEVDMFLSIDEYCDGAPSDTAYRPWRDRTSEDSELMVLARYHAQKYDEFVANDKAVET